MVNFEHRNLGNIQQETERYPINASFMKIAIWNIERPKTISARSQKIEAVLKALEADIIILTETNMHIFPGESYDSCHSQELSTPYYSTGERRVSIFTKYKVLDAYPTFRNDTSICIELETPMGNLIVYGTVAGILGNRRKDFMEDLQQQMEDLRRIGLLNKPLCYAGDLNISFSDNYYFTYSGRTLMQETFSELALSVTTRDIPQNIDHIVISDGYLKGKRVTCSTWNHDKKLSDHIGVMIDIQ